MSTGRLLHLPSPLRSIDRRDLTWAAEGRTVAELLEWAEVPERPRFQVWVDDQVVPPDRWSVVVPSSGQCMVVRTVAAGGGGGDKSVGRIVATIALAALTVYVGGVAGGAILGAGASSTATALVGGAAAAAVSIAGSLAINALIPPPGAEQLTTPGNNGLRIVQPTRNIIDPHGEVPRVYGRRRVWPRQGQLPYTQIRGNKVVITQVFVIGRGAYDVSDLRLGEQPLFRNTPLPGAVLDATSEAFDKVRVEIRRGREDDDPLTLTVGDVHEESLSVVLPGGKEGNPRTRVSHVRRTRPGVERISVDVAWPAGLYWGRKDGSSKQREVKVKVEYRRYGSDGAWLEAPGSPIRANENTFGQIRRGLEWDVPESGDHIEYDVQMTRLTPRASGAAAKRIVDRTMWTTLRSISLGDPTPPGVCKVAVEIQATNQLQGAIEDFNVVAHSLLLGWDSGTMSWRESASGTPAWVYLDMLTAPHNRLAIDWDDIEDHADVETMKAWAVATADEDRQYNEELVGSLSVLDGLRRVAAAGRASFTIRDGKYSVVRDLPQPDPVQFFTPDNSRQFRGTQTFPQLPHALRVRFANQERDWVEDEQFVYRDGYGPSTANGLTQATEIEGIEFPGVTLPEIVEADARYHLRVLEHRRRRFEIVVDPENLVCERGDLVHLTHDVASVGLGSGRIKSVTLDGSGDLTAITLDRKVEMESGKNYAVRVRLSDFELVLADVDTVVGTSTVLTLTTPIDALDPQPEPLDLWGFGEKGSESIRCVVKDIEALDETNARLVLVDEAPEIHETDDDESSAWAATETAAAVAAPARAPAAPSFDSIGPVDAAGELRVAVAVSVGTGVA